jgi:hypothetical protein
VADDHNDSTVILFIVQHNDVIDLMKAFENSDHCPKMPPSPDRTRCVRMGIGLENKKGVPAPLKPRPAVSFVCHNHDGMLHCFEGKLHHDSAYSRLSLLT